jgi:hypothetical protein
MTIRVRCSLAGGFLLTVLACAEAAPAIPSSELPGRERQRFQDSPLDRFTQPGGGQRTQPLWQWDCKNAKSKAKHRRSTSRRC